MKKKLTRFISVNTPFQGFDSDVPYDEADTDLLDRYFVGNVTDAERETVKVWAQKSLGGEAALQRLREMRIGAKGDRWSPGNNWNTLHATILASDRELQSASHVSGRKATSSADQATHRAFIGKALRGSIFQRVSIGALIATTAVAIAAIGLNMSEAGNERSIASQSTFHTTSAGERGTVILPDGSIVLLNVSSTLEVPSDFVTASIRSVRVTGEAMFTVKHKSESPFTVNARTTSTKVLGTTFTVRSYESDKDVTVAVQDGRVEVANSGVMVSEPRIIGAQQQISLTEKGFGAVQTVDSGRFTFSKGILTLREMPLSEAVIELNRWYNVDIRIGESTLADRRVKGQFNSGSVSDLASILQWTFNLRVDRVGKILNLYTDNDESAK